LPFDSLSQDDEIKSFCDGLAHNTRIALSKFRWLNVVSGDLGTGLKGHAGAVARDLGVRFILQGNVRQSGGRIRITAQLIEASSSRQIWAERYDRNGAVLFDLEDEVSSDIVASLEYVLWISLTRADSPIGSPDPAISPLRAAAWHITECTHAGNRAATSCAISALKNNPKSVAAYQYLANAYFVELFVGWTEAPEADVQSLLVAGRSAAALSPTDHLSQGLFACALAFAGNHDESLARTRRALELNSSSTNVMGPCGHALSFSGDARAANEMFDRMLRLAPGHYFRAGFLVQMALNWLLLSEPERGLPLIGEASNLKPTFPCCPIVKVQILTALGRYDEAKVATHEAYRLRPDLNRMLLRVMFAHRDRSVPERLADLLQIP
jgi:adenylate cyclase